MNVVGKEETLELNVLPLFENLNWRQDPIEEDLFDEMDDDFEEESPSLPAYKKILVKESQFPDQSMFVLDQQVKNLKESLERLKFYLSDMDDLLPR